MKVSLNWLTDYVPIEVPAFELAELLMNVGLEVDSIDETDADLVLDVEVTSNRSDCLGHIGIAREIAAATGRALTLPALSDVPTVGNVAEHTRVDVEVPAFCPRYTARLIRNVKVGPSPRWMVERLEAVGLRSINNVVDATNYVMMEYSQPLHAFDFDKLAGGRIVVRHAREGEQIVSIDETVCKLQPWMGIIADAEKPVAVAGVMGGLATEVSDATVTVLMEAAQFDPLTNRRTSRALGLMSESSYRYERGIDPVALEAASLRACELILQTSPGAELLGGLCDAWAEPWQAPQVTLRTARTNKLLGMDVPAERQVEILAALDLQPQLDGGTIVCTVPPHRADIRMEVDLIEEVGRVFGYDHVPTGSTVTHRVNPPAPIEAARKAIGQVLTGAGFFEAITFTFADDAEAELFGWSKPLSVDKRVRKTNNLLRQSLLPSLLRARKTNQDAGVEGVRLFELASVFPPGEGDDGLPAEHVQLALIADGELPTIRGALEAVLNRFDPDARLTVEAAEVAGFAPGASARLLVDGKVWGEMGVVDAKAADHYGLTAAPVAGAVRLGTLLALGQAVRQYTPVPRQPAIERDLSVVVDEALTWANLVETVRAAAGDLCESVAYVGAYRGKQLGPGRKSVTLRLTYRDTQRTLTHEEVDEQVKPVLEAVQSAHGAELRA